MIRSFLWLLLTAGVLLPASCRQGSPGSDTPKPSLPAGNEVTPAPDFFGWMAPVQLTGVETSVPMADYFPDYSAIDSLVTQPGIRARLSPDKKDLVLVIAGDPAFLSTLRIWAGGKSFDLLLKTPVAKKRAFLRLRDNGYKSVKVKGEMNSWKPDEAVMTKTNGIWEHAFELAPGDYQYLFLVDGKEMTDPKNPQKVSDGEGGFYSLLSIRTPSPVKPPKLTLTRSEGNTIELGIENPGAVLVFWENHLLQTRKEGGKIIVDLPGEAAKYPSSNVRAFAQNEGGVSGELLIPLRSGKAVPEK